MTARLKQPTLFPLPAKPRRKPRKLMRLVDAGHTPAGRDAVLWECPRCDYGSDWEPEPRPFVPPPCPKCNEQP